MTLLESRVESSSRYATPPTDQEKYLYLEGGQKRGLLVFQYLAFLGVIISLTGFATTSYWTFIFGIPLLLLFIEQTMALYTSTRPRQVTMMSHLIAVHSWAPDTYPSIDLFLPTAGEEPELLENTMGYLTKLEWLGPLQIYILDDSGQSAVHALADRYGMTYLARPGNEYKKAGNLRYAADRSAGDFVAILDADFVPRHDFLRELIPYFDDITVGIVQSPQFFDTSKELNWVQRTAGATQEFFYRFVQPSRDRNAAAICVGSSAIYRRSALEVIGGFPKISHSEDIYCSFEMTQRGLLTKYVPVVVSKGLCPDNIENFIAQQYRWCEGSMSMLGSKAFQLSAIPLRARLSYWSGFLYYIDTAVNAIAIPIPAIMMVWFYPKWVRPWNTVWLSGAILLWLVVYPRIMKGRWRVEVLRLQTVYGYAHFFNILNLMRHRAIGWHPTGSKQTAPISISVKRFYTYYLGIALLVLAGGLGVRTWHEGLPRFAGMLAFAMLNIYIIGPLVWAGARDELRLRSAVRLLERKPALHLRDRPLAAQFSRVPEGSDALMSNSR